MHFYWFEYLILLFVFFYGSKRDVKSTTIKFLGFTLYERHHDPALPPPKTTFALSDGDEVDEEEEDVENDDVDERDLWERLADAGFKVVDEERDLRLTDVGAIRAWKGEEKCGYCKKKTYVLSEVYEHLPDEGGRIGAALQSRLGCVCEHCGRVGVLHTSTTSRGMLAPLLRTNVNFFDVLDYLERVRGDDAEGAAKNADLPFLESRRDQLEAELNGVRTAIMREKHKNGEGSAYREADRPLAPESSDTESKEGDGKPLISRGIVG